MSYWLMVSIGIFLVAWIASACVIYFTLRRAKALAPSPLRTEATMHPLTEPAERVYTSPEWRHTIGLHRILIVGAGKVGQTLAKSLEGQDKNYIVGFADDDPDAFLPGEYPILGHRDQVPQIIKRYFIDEVILAYAPTWQQQMAENLAINYPEIIVRVVPSPYETMLSMTKVESHGDIALVHLVAHSNDLRDRVKRISDILLATFGLTLLSPCCLIVFLLIKMTSKGPAVFSQVRTGRFGRPFTLYKFRTMVTDAETRTGPILARGTLDARLTTIGKWIRLTRFDEVPQLWNVLRGEMSLVGPRPERPIFVEKFLAQTPAYAQRHQVRPGITGLAQICGGYHTDARDKLRFDLIYVSNYSLWLDISIMIRTILVVVMPNRDKMDK